MKHYRNIYKAKYKRIARLLTSNKSSREEREKKEKELRELYKKTRV